MKKSLLALLAASTLSLGAPAVSRACDGGGHECHCAGKHQQAAGAGKKAKAELVSLEGKVEPFGCQMHAARMQCTGAALVVGEEKHMIRKAKKGLELVKKAKGTDKLVKVSGTQDGDMLTVVDYQIEQS